MATSFYRSTTCFAKKNNAFIALSHYIAKAIWSLKQL